MKLTILKLTAILLILTGNLSSCTNKNNAEDEEITDPKTAFFGKWKLEFIIDSMFSIDCSQYNIVYEFKANNILMVSGNTDNIDNRIHGIGKYHYEVIPKSYWGDHPLVDAFGIILRIDTDFYGVTFGYIGDMGDILGMHISFRNDASPSSHSFVFVKY